VSAELFESGEVPLGAADRARLALAVNLRRARLARGLSLRALADLTGLSKASLSQLERGEGNPTVGALGRLATALDRSVTDLVRDTSLTPEVVRAVAADGRGVDVRTLFVSHELGRFEMTEGRLPPRTQSARSSHGAGSMEYAVVLEGRVAVSSNGWDVDLESGDAIRFSAEFEHSYVTSDVAARVLTIVSFTDG
jgi:XRE family transcriptional regulator, regulator of sulfur utilization